VNVPKGEMVIQLNASIAAARESWLSARPFPHVVFDALFPDIALREVLRHFPDRSDPLWRRFDNPKEKKLGFFHEMGSMPPAIRQFLDEMNGYEMLLFLEAVTGIEGLIGDPYFGGGGMHQIEPGGFLEVHTDFNIHPKLGLERRINLLIYLNDDWREEWGGELELWNRSLTECSRRISPEFNRTVVFETSDWSWHGHPRPLNTPAGVSRRSLSLYYYTVPKERRGQTLPHDTIFRQTE
jgi:hypothetical protein